MRRTENLMIGLVSLLMVFILPAGAKHLTSPEKLSRHVRAIEPSSQQQQTTQQQQPTSSLYGRSGDASFLDDGMTMSSETTRPSSARFLSSLPLEKLGYLFSPHDNSPRPERFMLPGIVTMGHPRVGRPDSNFIRFGRSFSGLSGGNTKKNNFIRLGRENPRQNNFIRLGRSGQWDSAERFLPKIGFFPDNYYYSTPSQWSPRPNDLPSYDDESSDSLASRLLRQG